MKVDGGRLLVITYHYVRSSGGPYPGIHPVDKEKLSKQITMLKKVFHAASVGEVEDFVTGKKPLEHDAFFLTFDDGLVDHYCEARAVLEEQEICGAFFVPTLPLVENQAPAVHKIHWLRANTEPSMFIGYLNELLPAKWRNLKLSEDECQRAAAMHIHDEPYIQQIKFALNFLIPYSVVDKVMSQMLNKHGLDEKQFCKDTFMSAEQIIEMRKLGHVVGLHGHTHTPLSLFSGERALDDVKRNMEGLNGIIGEVPKWLSYPYGRPDALPTDTRSFCNDLHIDIAFSLVSGFNQFREDGSALKRITPNELSKYI